MQVAEVSDFRPPQPAATSESNLFWTPQLVPNSHLSFLAPFFRVLSISRNSALLQVQDMSYAHVSEELADGVPVVVDTQFGPVRGGRARNGAQVFLGESIFDSLWRR